MWRSLRDIQRTAESISPTPGNYPLHRPSSLLIYSGKAFPAWMHKLFAGALVLRYLNRITIDEHHLTVAEERLLTELKARIRDVIEGPEGFLYLSTDSRKILRLRPSAAKN